MAASNAPLTMSLASLAGKSVFLDISYGDPHRLQVKFVRKHLKRQGAEIEDFFSVSVSYVITDRSCCLDSSTQSSKSDNLPRVTNYKGTNGFIKKAIELGTPVYHLATVEGWLRKNLKSGGLSSSAGGESLTTSSRPSLTSTFADSSRVKPVNTMQFQSSNQAKSKPVNQKPPIRLSGAFIRLDDKAGEYRPFYHEMKFWPSLRLDPLSKGACSTSAAGGSPFVDPAGPQPTIQPGPRLVAVERKNVAKPASMRGYCEACGMVVADIDRHLQGDEHARRIKKAATRTTVPTSAQKRSTRKSTSKTGGESDFVRPLATLDAVISQHFGPTPAVRMALLETYLEQALGNYHDRQNASFEIAQKSCDASSQDEGDEGDDEEEIPMKKCRNFNESQENNPPTGTAQPPLGNAQFDTDLLIKKLGDVLSRNKNPAPSADAAQPPQDSAQFDPDLLVEKLGRVLSTNNDVVPPSPLLKASPVKAKSPVILESNRDVYPESSDLFNDKPKVEKISPIISGKTHLPQPKSLPLAVKIEESQPFLTSEVSLSAKSVKSPIEEPSTKMPQKPESPAHLKDTWELPPDVTKHAKRAEHVKEPKSSDPVFREKFEEMDLYDLKVTSDSASSSSRKTRRLLPTLSATTQALAQLQSHPLSIEAERTSETSQLSEEIPSTSKKKPRKSSNPRSKKVKEKPATSPVIKGRSSKKNEPLLQNCPPVASLPRQSKSIKQLQNQPQIPATLQFPQAIANILSEQQFQNGAGFNFQLGNPSSEYQTNGVFTFHMQPNQQQLLQFMYPPQDPQR